MKPVYLEFCGLNSFEEKAQIDFSKLLQGGVFGIFGDTGSGKSTILDSIHFALYGDVNRAAKSTDYINCRSDMVSVTFDFEIMTDGVRHTYRVKRERRRKNGTTKAFLYERLSSGELLALAEGSRDVDEKIEEIIGLTFSDFKTCIALPQGDFAALVNSTAAERVKLVARLFNLEKYGERLAKAVNERYTSIENEIKVVKARMGENEGGNDELYARTQEEIASEKIESEKAQEALAKSEEKLQGLTALQKEKQAYDTLCKKLGLLQEKKDEMSLLRQRLEVYPKAQAVKEKIDERKEAGKQKTLAKGKYEEAKTGYENSLERQRKAKAYLEESRFDEKILSLSVQLQKVKDGAQDRAHAEKIKSELDACVAKYRALKDKCPAEDFAGKRAKLEEEISSLGEDNSLLDYLKRNYKGVLLADTYGEVRGDFIDLVNKHPSIEADVQPLLEKYTPQVGKETTIDVAAINLAFKEQEQRKKRLRAEIENLENRRLAYEANEKEKKLIETQGLLLRQNLALAMEKIADLKDLGTEKELVNALDGLNKSKTDGQAMLERTQTLANGYFADMQTQEKMAALHEEREKELQESVLALLQENGFESEAQALALVDSVGDYARMQKACNNFFEEYELTRRQVEETDKTKFDGFDENALLHASEVVAEDRERRDRLVRSLAVKENTLKRLDELREKYKEQMKELAQKEHALQVCEKLKKLLHGNKFLEFIASEYLQEVCLLASKTLLSLTGGRYFLQYDKDFKVGDNRDGGNLRAVKTLSGGETFLVSLSLALALSASICQKSRRPIEFFFLDEGFGTLDEKLVETVMDVLGKLSKSFSVGLISHVEELKRRIENKILVTGATELKGSTLRVETF